MQNSGATAIIQNLGQINATIPQIMIPMNDQSYDKIGSNPLSLMAVNMKPSNPIPMTQGAIQKLYAPPYPLYQYMSFATAATITKHSGIEI